MSIIAKCSKCEKEITEINFVPAPVVGADQPYKGTLYTCPHCHTVLNAGLDPLAQAAHITQHVRQMILAKQ